MPSTKFSFSFLFLVCVIFYTRADILPRDNSRINYTSVYFEEELVTGAHSYELVLYSDSARLNQEGGHFFIRTGGSVPAFHASGLNWSMFYFWRVEAYDQDHKLIRPAKLHHFSTTRIIVGFANATEAWLDIKTNKREKHAEGLLMIDYTRCVYNRNGTAVWTLPNIPGIVDEETQIRDLKFTRDHTITFLTDRNAVEIDLEGNVLWKAPSRFVFEKDTILYHHDLKKTVRGTYVVLGTRKVNRLMYGNYTEKQIQDASEITMINGKPYKKAQITVVLEFDKNGKLVWFWDANHYISDEDLAYKKGGNGLPIFSTHANAFSESEDGKTIYVGFRDLSRIVKVDKGSKKVKMSYGEKFPSGEARVANSAFRKQHDGTITKRKTLLIFNNNEPATKEGERSVSKLIEVKEDIGPNDSAVIWSFALDFDNLTTGFSPGGGNVTELPNSNLLLSAGTLNRILEVTRDKEVVWDALLMMRVRNDPNWRPFPQYRCSWIPYIKDFHFIPVLSKSDAAEVKLDLTNSGNTQDAYTVELLANGKSVQKIKTNPLASGEKLEQSISLKSFSKGAKQIILRIRSNQSGTSKELQVDF